MPEHSAGYLFGALVETSGETGTPSHYHAPDRATFWGDETVLDADPPHRLSASYRCLYNADHAIEPAGRATWQIEPDQNRVSLLTVVHDNLEHAPKTAERVAGPGWMSVLSRLKTLLETVTALSS